MLLFQSGFTLSSTHLFFRVFIFYFSHFVWLISSDCAFPGVGDMCFSVWQVDWVTGKQVVNRLKIPQCLSTLLFHHWSEVPSRGGVRGDSPYEKQPATQRHHLSVSQPCSAVGPLFGGSVSVRTRFSSLICSGCFFSFVFCLCPPSFSFWWFSSF